MAHKIEKFTYEPTTKQKAQSNKGKPLETSFREAISNDRIHEEGAHTGGR